MLTSGQPHATIPSVSTVTRDITASFSTCREKIGKLLEVSAKLSSSQSLYWLQLTRYDRTILDAFILQPMPGRRPTIGLSLRGPFTFSTKVKCSRFYWTLSRCLKYGFYLPLYVSLTHAIQVTYRSSYGECLPRYVRALWTSGEGKAIVICLFV